MIFGAIPYITTWSLEQAMPATVVELHGAGIGYLDETFGDRDRDGVLWQRVPSRPGQGRPRLGSVHPLRQRRAMRRLHCGICAGQADRDHRGVLWLLRDFRGDWPGWPEGMAATEPPVCVPCARRSVRVCPALRKGYAAVRVGRSEVAGVYGACYRAGDPLPRVSGEVTVAFEDPAVRWTQASQLVRELRDCTSWTGSVT